MNNAIKAAAITIVFAATAFGQNANANAKKTPEGPEQIPASGKRRAGKDDSKGFDLGAATAVQAALQNRLDVRRAKVGDAVVLKTVSTVKNGREVLIPKGSQLIGRITSVEKRSGQDTKPNIGILIERLEGRDFSAPVTAYITSIVSTSAAAEPPLLGDLSGSANSSASGSTAARGSGGGLLGGVASPVISSGVQTAGALVGSTVGAADNVAGTAGQTLGTTVSGATFSDGLQISNALSGSASGTATLTAAGNDLRLEKGVLFNLQVSPRPGN